MINRGGNCELCGYTSNLGAVTQHGLIPRDVTRQAGVPDYRTINLCCNCHFELQTWYKTKIADTVYDPVAKRFGDKSWEERVKDYESAYKEFWKYKEEQKEVGQGKLI